MDCVPLVKNKASITGFEDVYFPESVILACMCHKNQKLSLKKEVGYSYEFQRPYPERVENFGDTLHVCEFHVVKLNICTRNTNDCHQTVVKQIIQ